MVSAVIHVLFVKSSTPLSSLDHGGSKMRDTGNEVVPSVDEYYNFPELECRLVIESTRENFTLKITS